MAGPAFPRSVEDFLKSGISFENYALWCQPEPAKTSNGGGDSADVLFATGGSPAIAAAGKAGVVGLGPKRTPGKAGAVGLGRKRTPKTKTSGITYENLSRLFNKRRRDAAAELKICPSSFRNVCRRLRIKIWPYERRARGSGMQQTNTEVLEPTSPATVTEDHSSTITSDSEVDDGAGTMVDQSPREVVEPTSLASGYESDHGAEITDDQYPAQHFEPTYSAIVEAAAMEHSRIIPREDESGVGNQSREEASNPTFLEETNATADMEWDLDDLLDDPWICELLRDQ